MKKTFEGLLKLKGIDEKLDLLRSRLKDGPRILEKRKGEYRHEEETVERHREKIKAMKIAFHDKEVELKSLEGEIKKQETYLLAAKTNQEYTTIQDHINRLKNQVGALEEAILKAYDQVEEENQKLAAMVKELQIQKKELDGYGEGVDQEMGEYAAEIKALEAKREEVVGELDFETIKLYTRVKEARDGPAIVTVDANTCGGCHMTLTPNDLAKLRGLGEIVTCKSCQRILYLSDSE